MVLANPMDTAKAQMVEWHEAGVASGTEDGVRMRWVIF